MPIHHKTLALVALVAALAACDPTTYRTCDEAREAGVAPLHADDPGYSRTLDRDGDGIACDG